MGLTGATNVDWEDLASGPGAAVGGRSTSATSATTARCATTSSSTACPSRRAAPVPRTPVALPFRYPDGRHNAEALFVDPGSGRIYVLTKTMSPGTEPCALYRFPLPLRPGQRVTLEKVGGRFAKLVAPLRSSPAPRSPPTGRGSPSARTSTPGSGGAARARRSRRSSRRASEHVALALERQGESIAYAPDGRRSSRRASSCRRRSGGSARASPKVSAHLAGDRRSLSQRPGRRDIDSARVRFPVRLAFAFALVVSLLALPAGASAKEPPNQNDPCSSAGRNTCGTLGVGFYDTYEYGIRWFGDYRGAVADIAHTFCIDLQYWYPSREVPLRRVDGRHAEEPLGRGRVAREPAPDRVRDLGVGAKRQGEPAGRGHALRPRPDGRRPPGGGRPGGRERRRRRRLRAGGPGRDALPRAVPPRRELARPARVGEQATATVKVLSASGARVPNVELTLSARGTGVPAHVSTGSTASPRIAFTPKTDDGATIEARPSRSPRRCR